MNELILNYIFCFIEIIKCPPSPLCFVNVVNCIVWMNINLLSYYLFLPSCYLFSICPICSLFLFHTFLTSKQLMLFFQYSILLPLWLFNCLSLFLPFFWIYQVFFRILLYFLIWLFSSTQLCYFFSCSCPTEIFQPHM